MADEVKHCVEVTIHVECNFLPNREHWMIREDATQYIKNSLINNEKFTFFVHEGVYRGIIKDKKV